MFNSHREITIQRHRRNSKIKSSKIKSILVPKGNYLREFSSITSIHGIMYLGEPNRPLFERVFWIAIMILVMSLCGWNIYQLYNDWLSSRIITSMDDNKYNVWDVPFPAITFCSDVQLQNINNISLNDNLFNKETEEALNILRFQQNTNNNVTLKYIDPKNMQHVVENYKIECKNIIYKLYWIYDKIDSPCDYIQPILTTHGICYTLNMIPHHLLYKNSYHQMTSISNHTLADVMLTNESFWTPETSYSENTTPIGIPWRVTGNNIENSVRLEFDLKNMNSERGSSSNLKRNNSGLKIIIHSPADVPTDMTPIAYIIDKSMLTIALSMYYSITSSKIENWTPKIRNCYYQHEKVLKFFKLYTYQNCKLECVANNTLRTCGCNAFYQPRQSGTPVCASDNLACVTKISSISNSIFEEQMSMQNDDNEIHDDNMCNCLQACTNYIYEFKTIEYFRNWTTNSKKLHEDVAMIIIYFQDKFVTELLQIPLISFNDLLGNIGGLFGLFLGCSIISFFEILYYFVIRLYFDRRNEKKNKSKIFPNFVH